MFLLDTDVLSTLRRRGRNPQIVRWVETQRTANLYISVIAVGEIERGITQQQRHQSTLRPGICLSGWTVYSPCIVTGFYQWMSPRHAGGASCLLTSATIVLTCS